MLSLLGVTFIAGFTDALNPIAITQQMVLQSVAKQKKDILGFIIGIALTNFTFGMLIYFGLAALLQQLFAKITFQFPYFIAFSSLLVGLILIGYLIFSLFIKKPQGASEEFNKADAPKKTLSFIQLFGLGIVATGMELTSAVPYIAFLAFLVQFSLNPVTVVVILIFYNILFSWPLILIYIVSIRFEHRLTTFYKKLSTVIHWIMNKVVPALGFVIGLLLVAYGVAQFV